MHVGSSLLFVKYLEGKLAAAQIVETTVSYVVLGGIYIARKHGRLMRAFGPALTRTRTTGTAAMMGLVFGLNIPACAAPLLAAILAASVGTATVAQGFWMMAMFGVALSLPLIVAVSWGTARAALDRMAQLSDRAPL